MSATAEVATRTVVRRSSHFVQRDAPQCVVDAIRAVIAEAGALQSAANPQGADAGAGRRAANAVSRSAQTSTNASNHGLT